MRYSALPSESQQLLNLSDLLKDDPETVGISEDQ
jgi:hypothetical protein